MSVGSAETAWEDLSSTSADAPVRTGVVEELAEDKRYTALAVYGTVGFAQGLEPMR